MSRKATGITTAGNAKDAPVYHIGLDVHAADFTVAVAEPGRNGEVREVGTFSSDLHALGKTHRKASQSACGSGTSRRV